MTACKILCIGGNDPTGGAGLSMDVRVGQYFHVTTLPIVSCITAQDGERVSRVDWISSDQLEAQLNSVRHADGLLPKIIKIGLFANPSLIRTFADYYQQYCQDYPYQSSIIIYDPVLANGNNCSFLMEDENFSEVISSIKSFLLPICTIITPNHQELAILNNVSLEQVYQSSDRLAREILQLMDAQSSFKPMLMLSGGHGSDNWLIINSIYSFSDNQKTYKQFINQQRFTGNYRGTGCALALAVACHLVKHIAENKDTITEQIYQLIMQKSLQFVHDSVAYTYQKNQSCSKHRQTIKDTYKQILYFPKQ